jgi:hypothetical protein
MFLNSGLEDFKKIIVKGLFLGSYGAVTIFCTIEIGLWRYFPSKLSVTHQSITSVFGSAFTLNISGFVYNLSGECGIKSGSEFYYKCESVSESGS